MQIKLVCCIKLGHPFAQIRDIYWFIAATFFFFAGLSIFCFLISLLLLFFPISLQSGNLNLLFLISHLFPFCPYLHHSITASLNFLCYPIRLHSHYLPDLTPVGLSISKLCFSLSVTFRNTWFRLCDGSSGKVRFLYEFR